MSNLAVIYSPNLEPYKEKIASQRFLGGLCVDLFAGSGGSRGSARVCGASRDFSRVMALSLWPWGTGGTTGWWTVNRGETCIFMFSPQTQKIILALDWSAANILAKNLTFPNFRVKMAPQTSTKIWCPFFIFCSPQIFFTSPKRAKKNLVFLVKQAQKVGSRLV